jgi:AbiV family abortive infection protein
VAKQRLDQYKGHLEPSQIAEGMNAALDNAKRLAKAASLLLTKGDYALAASLSALSIEESGKLHVLRSLAVARDDKEVVECWREYRSHTKKNMMWPFHELFAKGARRLDDFTSLFGKDGEHPFLLDQLKQIGFYTDCLGKAHWSIPGAAIDHDLAKILVDTANIFANGRNITETEIQLWIKHLGPVWNGPKELMEHGLVRWYTEMQDQGLVEKGPNAMEEFIVSGVRQTSPQGETEEMI